MQLKKREVIRNCDILGSMIKSVLFDDELIYQIK